MNLVDILIWLILAGFVVKGFSNGLVRQICSLAGLLVGGWAAVKYYHYLAEASRSLIKLPHYPAEILSFITIFLVVGLLFFQLGHFLTLMLKIVLLGGVNRIGGALLGILEGAFVVCLLMLTVTSKPMPDKLRMYSMKSATAEPFIETGRDIVAGWGGGIPDPTKYFPQSEGTKGHKKAKE